jgi:hypothetical protein
VISGVKRGRWVYRGDNRRIVAERHLGEKSEKSKIDTSLSMRGGMIGSLGTPHRARGDTWKGWEAGGGGRV